MENSSMKPTIYRITRESHVNLRFNYAWGKNSHEAYFFIGEAL